MKKTVCIIFGGRSSEHEISCASAANILSYIDRDRYDVLTVGITKEGSWLLYRGDIGAIRDCTWAREPAKSCVLSPEPKHHGLLVFNKNGDVSLTHIDVVFPVLHGKNGEDGTIQGLLELSEIPYVGDGVLSSSACMDKVTAKELLRSVGIPVTEGFAVSAREAGDIAAISKRIVESFGYPAVVKPSNAGSSVGVTLVKEEGALADALSLAAQNDRRILVERAVNARELECSVLGGYEDAQASCVGEIVKKSEMYDYANKYVNDTTELAIPAEIDAELSERVRELAVRAFHTLDGFGLARVDFFFDRDRGELMLNELNTLPGFTNISMYPRLWMASGVDNRELVTRLIEMSDRRDGRDIGSGANG